MFDILKKAVSLFLTIIILFGIFSWLLCTATHFMADISCSHSNVHVKYFDSHICAPNNPLLFEFKQFFIFYEAPFIRVFFPYSAIMQRCR